VKYNVPLTHRSYPSVADEQLFVWDEWVAWSEQQMALDVGCHFPDEAVLVLKNVCTVRALSFF
jgi:hypothetical protein